MWMRVTCPKGSKRARSSVSVFWKLIFPKHEFLMVLSPDGVYSLAPARLWSFPESCEQQKRPRVVTRSPFKRIKRFLQEQQTHLEYTMAFRRFPLQRT